VNENIVRDWDCPSGKLNSNNSYSSQAGHFIDIAWRSLLSLYSGIMKKGWAQWLLSKINKENPLQLGSPPACTSLLDGFGDSPDLGANSMGSSWALRGREAQRVASKTRAKWERVDRPTRVEACFRPIARRSFVYRMCVSKPNFAFPEQDNRIQCYHLTEAGF